MTQREGAYPESLSLRCDPTLGHCAGKPQLVAYSPQCRRLVISRPLLMANLSNGSNAMPVAETNAGEKPSQRFADNSARASRDLGSSPELCA